MAHCRYCPYNLSGPGYSGCQILCAAGKGIVITPNRGTREDCPIKKEQEELGEDEKIEFAVNAVSPPNYGEAPCNP